MTSTAIDAVFEEIAQLRSMVTELNASRSRCWWSWRRKTTVVGAVALAVGAITGVAGASGPSNAGLSFVPVSPAFKLATNVSVGPGKANSYAVSGASTTVPTDASTVRFNVMVKGAQAGTLSLYPAANSPGSSGQSLSWAAGGSASGTIMENVGASNKVVFFNSSLATATLTATITGYSTQVAASDISATGGSSGQVLTNTGSGAMWRSLPLIGYGDQNTGHVDLNSNAYATVDTVQVPAGIYQVIGDVTVRADVSDLIWCYLISPGLHHIYDTNVATVGGEAAHLSLTGLLETTGGGITLQCNTTGAATGSTSTGELVATQIQNVHGAYTSG